MPRSRPPLGDHAHVDDDFTTLAALPDPRLDRLSLALAASFRSVDAAAALAELDRLGEALRGDAPASPEEGAESCRRVLGVENGFSGDRDEYDHPRNSMLDLVLQGRRGLPILLSTVYAEAGRRAGMPLAGVGLPGHYVVGHFGGDPPLLIDPFAGGVRIAPEVPPELVRPWTAHETALRMLNNLVGSYTSRGDLALAIRAAGMRLALPLPEPVRQSLTAEHRALQARLN